MRKLGIILASLVGACAIHLMLVACGSSGGKSPSTDSTQDAHAQSTPSTCTSWQISSFYQPNVFTDTNGNLPTGLGSVVTLPAGWEPIQAGPFGGTNANGVSTSGVLAIVRQCSP
jgi:hypothetical protein